MGQIILLAVAAIIWAVIKAISQPPPKRPVPRAAAPQRPTDLPPTPVKPFQPLPGAANFTAEPETLQVEEVDASSPSFQVSSEDIIQGVIMAEVLGPPRAKNPHRPRHRI